MAALDANSPIHVSIKATCLLMQSALDVSSGKFPTQQTKDFSSSSPTKFLIWFLFSPCFLFDLRFSYEIYGEIYAFASQIYAHFLFSLCTIGVWFAGCTVLLLLEPLSTPPDIFWQFRSVPLVRISERNCLFCLSSCSVEIFTTPLPTTSHLV